MGGETRKREENLRERVDSQLGVSLDIERKARQVACYLVTELLPSEDKAKAEPEKPIEPQGWFEQILHRLNQLKELQRATMHSLTRLREAVTTGVVVKPDK